MNQPHTQTDLGNVTPEGVSVSREAADPGLVEAVVERARRALAEARPVSPVSDPARDDLAEIIVPVAQPGAGTTNPGSAPVETETITGSGRGDLRASAIEAASERVHERWMATKRAQGAASRRSETGEELMVPYAELSEAAKDLDRGSVAATVDALLAAGWRPPLPESETQWGTRDRHGQVHSVGVENEAQARSMRSMTPVRREVGPWIEVTS